MSEMAGGQPGRLLTVCLPGSRGPEDGYQLIVLIIKPKVEYRVLVWVCVC